MTSWHLLVAALLVLSPLAAAVGDPSRAQPLVEAGEEVVRVVVYVGGECVEVFPYYAYCDGGERVPPDVEDLLEIVGDLAHHSVAVGVKLAGLVVCVGPQSTSQGEACEHA